MYPNYETFAHVVYGDFLVFALLVSGLSGLIAALLLRLRVRTIGVVTDALVGAIFSLVTVYALGHFGFEYSFSTAVVVAIILPTLLGFYRSKRGGSGLGQNTTG